MSNLAVLPSQKGKLSNEPDWSRKFGIEIEYDPDGETMLAYRLALYRRGIDTLDDTCATLNQTRINERHPRGPERFYDDVDCACGRGNHLAGLFGFANEDVVAMFPDNAESVFQSCHKDWADKDLLYIVNDARRYTNAYTTGLKKLFPQIKEPLRRHWNLGTDPSAGFELRTVPLYGKEGWAALEDACAALTEIGGHATQACGGHVHQDMTHEDGPSTARILATYNMIEPLLAAVVDPTRYYDGSYNAPGWRSSRTPTTGTEIRRIQTQKTRAATHTTRWMNSEAIVHHGSFEFRGLEGTLDPRTFKNWSLLINRFLDASRKSVWGVQLKQTVPIQVNTESILAFFKFLDITRKDVAPELKEVRDWYLERVREFSERDSFQQALIVPGNKVFASLKDLRKTGKFGKIEVFKEPVNPQAKKSAKEHGVFLFQVFERYIAGVRPIEGQRIQGEIYETFTDAYQRVGVQMPNRENYSSRDEETFGWMCRSGDGQNCQVLDEFWKYLRAYEFELLGKWFEDNMTAGGQPIQTRLEGLGMIFEEWASSWGREWPSHKSLSDALTSGDISCVDF
jgi:hypothetical protein